MTSKPVHKRLAVGVSVGLLIVSFLLGSGTAASATRASGSPGNTGVLTNITTSSSGPALGVYAGPAAKGVAGAQAFETWAGAAPAQVLDFASTDSWYNITGPSWMLTPWAAQSARLEYSLPMMPVGSAYSLAACAAGTYNSQWTTLATNLVAKGLDDTIVRPGWEFNGNWFYWAAAGKTTEFIGCFRNIVTTMRAQPGQHFAFDWNPSIGPGAFAAELAYPGDEYVDYIGLDVYDYNWYYYPAPPNATEAQIAAAQLNVWNYTLNGNHGLNFWHAFADSHGKPLSIPEWGVGKMTDGHAGGDNPSFVTNMFQFAKNPQNNVAYLNYFEYDSTVAIHRLGSDSTLFPRSAEEFRSQTGLLSAGY